MSSTLAPAFAVGVSRQEGSDEYNIAIRLRAEQDLNRPELSQVVAMARGEVDLRYIGNVTKANANWQQLKNRPLMIGGSVGHYATTAGTLGCFVTKRGATNGDTFILSNNHVLAQENDGVPGDSILQPAAYDGGTSADVVATLDGFVHLSKANSNLVDAAIAQLDPSVQFDRRTLTGLGVLSGISAKQLDVGMPVQKIGRTTGLTFGRVTAFELDDVVVGYEIGALTFDGQIEIESIASDPVPFSSGGDSGSLIVDEEFGALGLLFAGSEAGGTNGAGLTYASPIETVLDLLQIDLLF